MKGRFLACDRETDRQTDGIAIASTALAMQALQRTVQRENEVKNTSYSTVPAGVADLYAIVRSRLVVYFKHIVQ